MTTTTTSTTTLVGLETPIGMANENNKNNNNDQTLQRARLAFSSGKTRNVSFR